MEILQHRAVRLETSSTNAGLEVSSLRTDLDIAIAQVFNLTAGFAQATERESIAVREARQLRRDNANLEEKLITEHRPHGASQVNLARA